MKRWSWGRGVLAGIITVSVLSACGGDTNQAAPGSVEVKRGAGPTASAKISSPAIAGVTQDAQSLNAAAQMLTSQEAATPDRNGFLPNAQGLYPDAHGNYPQDAGLYINENGIARSYSTVGPIDRSNPFFQSFGNGRTCNSCHRADEGFSVTPRALKQRFAMTMGMDPIFALVDGANSPHAPVATYAQRLAAYSMLLNKGVIRVGLKLPANAEFELAAVSDPYGYASANELSLFRRPLPSANLNSEVNIMWDGRETALDPNSKTCLFGGFLCFASLDFNLAHQANSATRGHAQAAADLTPAQQAAIVAFERTLYTAQLFDFRAGYLAGSGAKGGPGEIANTAYAFGMNDFYFGNIQTGGPFNPNVMQLYGAWNAQPATRNLLQSAARQSIARGEALFNGKSFKITGVAGINDDLHIPVLVGTCSTCHSAPQAGNNTTPFPLNIGTADGALNRPDLPLYTLRNKTTGETVTTHDPGAAAVTGNWRDIGRFKTTNLRGLSSRAPYFHDGSAASLRDVVVFYNQRFGIGYTEQEITDLTAFLAAL